MKIFQIASELNVGSVGRVAEGISDQVIARGWDSYIAYGREGRVSKATSYKIGGRFNVPFHVIATRLTDRHGLFSQQATKKLIERIKSVDPDLIQLHHLHGYYINIKILFEYLQNSGKPVVWVFHDCWSFTGHCAHYEMIDCNKWKTGCYNCPQHLEYPKSFIDASKANYEIKKELFCSIKKMIIVPVSKWLGKEVKQSFLKECDVEVIENGIDLSSFYPRNVDRLALLREEDIGKKIVLGVASPWTERKGLAHFIKLSELLDPNKFKIVLIGLNDQQLQQLPQSIMGLKRTVDLEELANYYSIADVFVNPTLEEALGLTNIEALACGTPVVTYKSGGSPETISDETGVVVEKADLNGLLTAINTVCDKEKPFYTNFCVARAQEYFDKDKNFARYIRLYERLLLI